jgi:hypothetical protein
VVVVINHNQVSKLKMTCHAGSLTGNTLHGTSISEEAVGIVVDEVKAGLVEDGSAVLLGNGKTDGIAETLTQRTSGHFDTRGIVGFGMSGCDGIDLLQHFELCGGCMEVGRSFY